MYANKIDKGMYSFQIISKLRIIGMGDIIMVSWGEIRLVEHQDINRSVQKHN